MVNIKNKKKKFNLLKFLEERPLSWSAISSFEYNPDQWFKRYILGKQDPPSKEMLFGSMIGKKLEKDPTFLPEIVRYSKMEYPFKGIFSGYPMVGYADTFDEITKKKLGEFKTGKRAWDQKRADEHGQIDMYLLMNYMMTGVRPEEVEVIIWWMPTVENADLSINFVKDMKPVALRTKRTMVEVLQFGVRIEKVVAAMQKHCDNHL